MHPEEDQHEIPQRPLIMDVAAVGFRFHEVPFHFALKVEPPYPPALPTATHPFIAQQDRS
jgi:hypothetical protein